MSETSTNAYPVDSTNYTLPDGRTVIGKDAYEAEMVKSVFAEKASTDTDESRILLAAWQALTAIVDVAEEGELRAEFVGALSATCGQTPEGRAAWARALEAVKAVRS